MKAGILTEKIELWQPKNNLTPYGNKKVEWEYVCTTRAAVDYVSGSRAIIAEEMFYPQSRTFIVRHYVNVQEPMRIRYNCQEFQITSISRNKKHHDILITADLVNE